MLINKEIAKLKVEEKCSALNYKFKKFEFIGVKTRLVIKCSNEKHPEWVVSYNNFINADSKCRLCKSIDVTNKIKFNSVDLDNRITKFELEKNYQVNRDFEYTSAQKTIVKIKCNIENHGIWEASIRSITRQDGRTTRCPKCIAQAKRDKKILSQDEAEFKVNKICLENEFVCERFEYIGSDSTILSVRCKHNHIWNPSFTRLVHNHRGCPDCNKNGFNKEIIGYFYIHLITDNNGNTYYKFGITNNTYRRFKEYKNNLYHTSEFLVCKFENGIDAFNLEKMIKSNLNTGVLSKEEYKIGYTETIDENSLPVLLNLLQKFETAQKTVL